MGKLIPTAELARRWDVTPQAVHQMRNRYRDMPAPDVELPRMLLWDPAKMMPWWRSKLRGEAKMHSKHGTRGRYNRGCKCARCLKANREYMLGYRAKKRGE